MELDNRGLFKQLRTKADAGKPALSPRERRIAELSAQQDQLLDALMAKQERLMDGAIAKAGPIPSGPAAEPSSPISDGPDRPREEAMARLYAKARHLLSAGAANASGDPQLDERRGKLAAKAAALAAAIPSKPHPYEEVFAAARAGEDLSLHKLMRKHDLLDGDRFAKLADSDGLTPLMAAALSGRERCCQVALPYSERAAKDSRGRTALMLALSSGNLACSQLLWSDNPAEASEDPVGLARQGGDPATLAFAAERARKAATERALSTLREGARLARAKLPTLDAGPAPSRARPCAPCAAPAPKSSPAANSPAPLHAQAFENPLSPKAAPAAPRRGGFNKF